MSKETKAKYYRVVPGRVLHYQESSRPKVWAREGEVVRIDHPVLFKAIEGQMHKLTPLKGRPPGEQMVQIIPGTLLSRIQEFDRLGNMGSSSGKFPDVARPRNEVEVENKKLREENSRLAQQIKELKGEKETVK